jgi:hypothetical protein
LVTHDEAFLRVSDELKNKPNTDQFVEEQRGGRGLKHRPDDSNSGAAPTPSSIEQHNIWRSTDGKWIT